MKKTLRILITAGPTVEPIDPVRYISNRSTGYMGYKLATLARKRSHKVVLISGPTAIKPPHGVKHIPIETALQLYKKVHQELKKADVLIMASAVSDFRPLHIARAKIKSQGPITLKLVKNRDILRSLSLRERKGKLIVGFALETGNVLQNAAKKLKEKRLDFIIANTINRSYIPFGKGDTTVYFVDNSGYKGTLKRVPKSMVARAILDTVEELCYTSP